MNVAAYVTVVAYDFIGWSDVTNAIEDVHYTYAFQNPWEEFDLLVDMDLTRVLF